jgi:hypothetical protein
MSSTPPPSAEAALRAESADGAGDPGATQDPDVDVPVPDEQVGAPEPEAPERVRTGSDQVDEVIRAVEELDDRPIEEHVAVFESAQVQLRRALDDPGPDAQLDQPEQPEQP